MLVLLVRCSLQPRNKSPDLPLKMLPPGPLIVVALLYEAMGMVMAYLIKQFFWVPHRFRYGILVAGGWANVGDIRESFGDRNVFAVTYRTC